MEIFFSNKHIPAGGEFSDNLELKQLLQATTNEWRRKKVSQKIQKEDKN